MLFYKHLIKPAKMMMRMTEVRAAALGRKLNPWVLTEAHVIKLFLGEEPPNLPLAHGSKILSFSL